MDFKVRGPPQLVGHTDKKSHVLHDPLLATMLDFDRRALDQLAHGLHLTVIYTFNNARKINKDRRFLFKYFQRFVNPSKSPGGKDVFSLLRNIQNNLKTYSKSLQQEKKEIKKVVRFILNNIRNAMAHQTYLNCDESGDANGENCALKKTRTTKECLEKCAQLLQWVVEADFYQDIHEKVKVFLTNIKNMKEVFEDFKDVKQSMEEEDVSCTDTEKAKDFLRNLLNALEKEEEQKPIEEEKKTQEKEKLIYIRDRRPITHFVNKVLVPRFNFY